MIENAATGPLMLCNPSAMKVSSAVLQLQGMKSSLCRQDLEHLLCVGAQQCSGCQGGASQGAIRNTK